VLADEAIRHLRGFAEERRDRLRRVGEVLHNDDTTIKILELMGARVRQEAKAEEPAAGSATQPGVERKGMYTSGIVATSDGHKIALFFSGRQHAGENLRDVLTQRAAGRPQPIQMCDALSRNLPGELATIVAHCLAHGRRQFVDVAERFPAECQHVLEWLSGVYLTGTVLMKSNVKLYVDADAVIRGSRKNVDYTSASAPGGGRQFKAFFVFNNVKNASLMGRGTIDMQGYPWLWHDFQPDTGDGRARDASGKVIDPRNGVRGYVINNSRNVSFQGLLLLRSAYWTVNVFGSQYFSTRKIKIVNRKQQYHDDAYDFRGSSHILIEDGFAMSMDDTFALYGGGGGRRGGAASAIEDLVVKGFVNYGYTSSLVLGYGSAPPVRHLRFEDVHFVSTHNKFAIWIQLTPAYLTGRGYSAGARASRNAALDDFRFVHCTFERDGGHIYIDAGDLPLTNFAFENCIFYKPSKPGLIMGKNVAPILFMNIQINGAMIQNAQELQRVGLDLSVPVKVEP
jgi:hypothetical protein